MLDDCVFNLLREGISSITKNDPEIENLISNSIEIPPSIELGERSSNIAFKMAKILKQAPIKIAETISEEINQKLSSINILERTEAINGYINFFFNFLQLFSKLKNKISQEGNNYGKSSEGNKRKIIVEHTSINPVKPLHIGNLRNAILGDILARLYTWNGWEVEVQNLIDDLGRQVATLIWGFLNGYHLSINRIPDEKYDVWLGKVYSYCNSILEQKNAWKEIDQLMINIRENPTLYKVMRDISQRCVDANLETAWKHGITYNYLVWESDISRSEIWKETLNLLEKNESFYWEKEGSNAGCFIAYLGNLPEFQDKKNPVKIFIRSNGVPTYVAHDVALQLWKFGMVKASLKSRSINKQINERGETRELWSSTDLSFEESSVRKFGKADRICNVIGYEQDYLQEIVRYSLKLLELRDKYNNSFHLSYKHVTAPYARFSGRTGNWYEERAWADAVLQDTLDEVFKVITSKRPDLDQNLTKKREITNKIAIGAVRYWLTKFSTETEIKFRIEDATSLEGDTGPFLVYSYVRATKILEKIGNNDKNKKKYEINNFNVSLQEKQLILEFIRFPEIIKSAAISFQPIQVTKYAYNLAAVFNKFYETCPVISAETSDLKGFRSELVKSFQTVMGNALHILGIPVVDEM